MSDYYSNPANIRDKFAIRVDWDIDVNDIEGCHGTDTFFQDDPVEVPFTVYKNGEVHARWGNTEILEEHAQNRTYVLISDGKLFERASSKSPLLRNAAKMPTAHQATVCSMNVGCVTMPAFSANEEFYACYLDSADFNRNLTSPQKAVVDRFFSASQAAFPKEFAFVDARRPRPKPILSDKQTVFKAKIAAVEQEVDRRRDVGKYTLATAGVSALFLGTITFGLPVLPVVFWAGVIGLGGVAHQLFPEAKGIFKEIRGLFAS